jgi:hypothetical protein
MSMASSSAILLVGRAHFYLVAIGVPGLLFETSQASDKVSSQDVG